jgi:hypothetical protein
MSLRKFWKFALHRVGRQQQLRCTTESENNSVLRYDCKIEAGDTILERTNLSASSPTVQIKSMQSTRWSVPNHKRFSGSKRWHRIYMLHLRTLVALVYFARSHVQRLLLICEHLFSYAWGYHWGRFGINRYLFGMNMYTLKERDKQLQSDRKIMKTHTVHIIGS